MNRHTLVRFLRPETAFFFLVWFALLFVFRDRGFLDPGSLWHTVVGEIILTDGFPRTDPFTYTFEGKKWIPQQWGAEVAMALAHRVGELDTMLLGFATLVAGLWTWVFAQMRANGMNAALAGVLTAAALCAGGYHFFVRPHMATIVLMGWTMACLVDYERGRVTVWRLAGLVPLYVVWTNLHGGVLGGVMTFGLAVAGWGALFLASGGRQPPFEVPEPNAKKQGADAPRSPIDSWPRAWLLVGIVIACGLTPLINPFGLEMIETWQRIVGSEQMPKMVTEHMPLSLNSLLDSSDANSGPTQVILGFGALYLLLFAGTLNRWPRITWLLPLVWLALTFKGIRQGPLFAVTAAIALADFWPHTVWYRLLKKYGDSLVYDPAVSRPSCDWRAMVLPAMAVLCAFALQAANVSVPLIGRGWAFLNPKAIPVDLNEAVLAYQESVGPGGRIFNDVNLGGYLIYHARKLKIYADDRFELSGDEWLKEYQQLLYDHPEWIEDMADDTRHPFDRAIIIRHEPATPLQKYLENSPRWQVVQRGERASLFKRIR